LQSLVVGLAFNPVFFGQPSDQALSELVVDEDEDGERHRGEPPLGFDRVDVKSHAHAGGVAEKRGQSDLEDDGEVEEPVGHPVLEERKASGLADDQLGNLNDDDGDKEGRLASVFQLLAVVVRPLLAVRILDVVDHVRVPSISDAQKRHGQEAILCHDDKVGEHSGGGLDDAQLSVDERDHPLVHKFVRRRVSRHSQHDVGFGFLVGQRDGGENVGAQIDAQDGDCAERERNTELKLT
jgi:hypothetical protein